MGKYVTFGHLADLEAKRREAQAAKAEQGGSPHEPGSSPEPLPPREPGSLRPPMVVHPEPRSPDEPRSPREPPPAILRVPARAGFTKVTNTIFDALLPLLEPFEQVVYLRLYRLSHGFGRDECEVGSKSLMLATGIGKTKLVATLNALEAKGLIARLVVTRKGNAVNRYRVYLPDQGGSRDEPRSQSEPGPPDERGSRPGHMKDPNPKKQERKGAAAPVPTQSGEEEKDPKWQARLLATRLYEAHKHTGTYSRAQHRHDLMAALVGQLILLDSDVIEWALDVFPTK